MDGGGDCGQPGGARAGVLWGKERGKAWGLKGAGEGTSPARTSTNFWKESGRESRPGEADDDVTLTSPFLFLF